MRANSLFSKLNTVCNLVLLTTIWLANPTDSFAVPPGCDKKFYDVSAKQAQAKVAYKVAAADEIVEAPPSAPAMICFDKAVAASEEKSSQIVSGSFMQQGSNKIKETLANLMAGHYKNFDQSDSSVGYNSGFSGNPSMKIGETTPYECDGIGNVVDKMDNSETKVIPRFEEVMGDIERYSPSGDTSASKFNKSWQASSEQNIAKDAQSSLAEMEANTSYLSFAQDETPCQILLKSGLNISCNPTTNNSGHQP